MLGNDFIKGNVRVARSVGIFLGISGINAVHFGGFQYNFGTNFGTTQRSGRVSCKKWITGSCGEDNHLTLFKILQSLRTNIRLHHPFNAYGRHHTGNQASLVHGVAQCQRIHDRGEHAHVIGGGTVHANRTTGHTTKNISAANDHGHLYTHPGDFSDFFDHADDGSPVDSEGVITHQGFT